MSMELLRLGLQFFAGETKEEEEEVIVPGEVTNPTGAVVTTPIVPAAAPIAPTREQYGKDVGEMDEAGYYAKYDLDPERDYLNTVNTLNYEYQTSMATYGENAGKMYQMGLQNSGVSDIFQANAFSSYLGNMNQAAANRITARKRNKAAFEDYVAGINKEFAAYEQNWKNDRTNTENTAFTAAAQAFNGYNLEEVRQLLIASNYDQGIIDNVMNRIGTLDPGSLKNATAREIAGKILEVIPNFTGSDADIESVNALFGGAVPTEALNSAISMARTLYENSPEAADATVNSWIDTLYGSFTGNEVDFDDWKNSQLKDVPEELQNKIIEGIRHEFDGRVGEIYSDLVERYTPENEASLKEHYKNLGYNDYEISEAMRMIKNVYNNDPGAQAATTEKNVAAIISTFGENAADFDPSNYGNDKQTFIDEMIKDGTYNAEEAGQAWEQMNGQFLNNAAAIAASVTDRSLINSKSDDNVIKGLIENAGLIATPGLIKAVRDELAKGDNFNESVANDLATNDVETVKDNLSSNKNDKGYNSINDYFNALDSYDAIDAQYGNTGATDPDRENAKNTVNTIIANALSGSSGNLASPDTARTLEGIISNTDIENWGNMSDDERKRAVLSGIKNSGRFSVSEREDYVVDYVDSKIREIIDVDNQNLKASGLADVGDLVNYINSLGLTKTGTNKAMESIFSGMPCRIKNDKINWYRAMEGAETTIKKNNYVKGIVTNDSVIKELNKNTNPDVNFAVYDNKLYQKSGESWYEIKPDELQVIGDGHTNTSEQTKGIYKLLVYMLDPNTGKVTPGGTGGIKDGVITDDKTGGGRTKDFSTTNK